MLNSLHLVICYTERHPCTRLFSARKAEPYEEVKYNDYVKHLIG
jgi:uncharacterized DUF497 family protein